VTDEIKVATINEDGDLEVVGEIESKEALVEFLASIRPDRLEDLDD
jgi:ubiquinone biosynthesis protein UbiJ